MSLLDDRERENQREIAETLFEAVLDQLRAGCPYFSLSADDCPGADEKSRRACEIRTLTHVNVERTDISDVGLRYIAALPKLEVLVLSQANVTDQGIRHLANTQSLQTLVLEQTRVTADGLVALRTLPYLQYLLYDVDISDPTDRRAVERIVAALNDLRNLKKLEIGGNWVSDEIVRRLQATHGAALVWWLKDRDDRWYVQGVFVPPDLLAPPGPASKYGAE